MCLYVLLLEPETRGRQAESARHTHLSRDFLLPSLSFLSFFRGMNRTEGDKVREGRLKACRTHTTTTHCHPAQSKVQRIHTTTHNCLFLFLRREEHKKNTRERQKEKKHNNVVV